MKKLFRMIGALLALSISLLTSACQAGPAADAAPSAVQPEPTAVAPDGGEAFLQARNRAYYAALDDLLSRHLLPDGTDCGYDPNSDPSGNQFAICDVDADGRDELILAYTATYTAGQTLCVLDYDESGDRLRTELTEYPLLTFYDNGTARADWSHNQGLAGSFWPYTLYQYAPDTDRYEAVGMADAWEKAFAPTDAQGAPFPDEIDASGTGFVYYLIPGNTYAAVTPVDAAAYQAWYDSYLGDACEVPLPYAALTSENIAFLR